MAGLLSALVELSCVHGLGLGVGPREVQPHTFLSLGPRGQGHQHEREREQADSGTTEVLIPWFYPAASLPRNYPTSRSYTA